MFPEQEFFTLDQISSQWGVGADNIQHVIMSGKLKAHLWIERTLVHKIEPDSCIEPTMVSGAMDINGHIGLFAHDCRKLFSKGKVAVRKFPADNSGCYRLVDQIPAIELEYGNIIIIRDEKSRFEMKYKLNENGLYINSRQQEYYFKGKLLNLGPIQSNIINQLADEHSTNKPWVHGKTQLHNAFWDSFKRYLTFMMINIRINLMVGMKMINVIAGLQNVASECCNSWNQREHEPDNHVPRLL